MAGFNIHPCNECEYKKGRVDNLRTHQKNKHEESQYLFDQCDYRAARHGSLKLHKRFKHDDNIDKQQPTQVSKP